MDLALTTTVTPVRRIHVIELRTALDEAYQATGLPLPMYTDQNVTVGETLIRAIHLEELRAAVRALE